MIFEIMGADLFKVMKWYDYEGIPVPIVRVIAKQILIALHYLHEHVMCIHTDIKPENILIVPWESELLEMLDKVDVRFKSHIQNVDVS